MLGPLFHRCEREMEDSAPSEELALPLTRFDAWGDPEGWSPRAKLLRQSKTAQRPRSESLGHGRALHKEVVGRMGVSY